MKLDLELTRRTGGAALRCTWDSDAGTVTGPDAEEVKRFLDSAVKSGFASLYPEPSSCEVSDPYRRPEEFAAVMGYLFHLPPDLQAVYPVVEEIDDTVYAVAEDGSETPIGHILY